MRSIQASRSSRRALLDVLVHARPLGAGPDRLGPDDSLVPVTALQQQAKGEQREQREDLFHSTIEPRSESTRPCALSPS
jgi:hypothetical protein